MIALNRACTQQRFRNAELDLHGFQCREPKTLESKAGYIDARPLTANSTKTLATHGRTIHLGHVWTAPWQELSDVFAALVGCGHVSGLLMRQVWPLALMLCADWVPIESTHLEVR